MNIGKRLKAYREYHQLTQEDLATKAGVNEKYYGRIERNESCPTVDKLEKICTALGIELSELFLYHTRHDGRVFWLDQRIANATVRGLQNDIDIHRMTLTFILIEMLFWMAAITVCGTTDIYAP